VAEDLGEKTEDPTGKRLGDARNRGQVPKSADFSAFIIMAGAVVAMVAFAVGILSGMARITRHILSEGVLASDITGADTASHLALIGNEVVRMILPIMAMMCFVSIVAHLIQTGPMIATKALEPKIEKLNPITGAKRFFSKRSYVKGGLDLLKLIAVGGVATLVIMMYWDRLIAMAGIPVAQAVRELGEMMVVLAAWILAVMLVLGVLDYLFQKWQHTQDLKMTKQEVKDERKSSDGDLEMKARRMKIAREIALQRVAADVPKADVVVTNPTHYAVALKYDQERMHAPRVVAKGADFLAMRIRQIASMHGIPIVERPPLARALYAQLDVGQEINADHYEAVAEILAYVYRLEQQSAPGVV
jgi:flagellar biosynthesis protein FlhB